MNDIILAKISGVSYVVGAIVGQPMPLLQKVALIVAITSGGLSIGDRLIKMIRKSKPTNQDK